MSDTKPRIIGRYGTIEVPMTPNFIRRSVAEKDEGVMVSVAYFTDAELKAIARAWGLELIKKAKKRRSNA